MIGSNGAGKTTLLRVILGLQRPSAGRVRIAGGGRRNRSVGYVPQKVLLDPDMPMRARDLVELGLDGNRFGIPVPSKAPPTGRRGDAGCRRRHRVRRHARRPAFGGEQQRVLIAHALVARPELLLLDEPLANLDLRSGHEIVALLHQITCENGISVLLSAHEMNPLLPVMDRLVYLAGGRAATGTTDEVVRGEVLSRLYGHHVDVVNVHGRVLVVVGPNPTDDDASAPHPIIEVS